MSDKQNTTSSQQTLQQKRAKHAWDVVNNQNRGGQKFKKEFTSNVRKLPSMIINDGLGQSLAFLLAQAKGKKDDAHYVVYKAVSDWVCQELKLNCTGTGLMDYLLDETTKSSHYRRASTEALAYLTWLKRFTEAKEMEWEIK